VAWLLPELELGAEPELKPPEFEFDEFEFDEFEFELELEFEPVEAEPDELEPVDELPVEEPDDEEEDAVLCVDPGRASATMPAAATLAMVTVVVADRTLARPRSRSAMARRTRSRYALLMYPILRSRTRSLLYGPSRSAMRQAACPVVSGEITYRRLRPPEGAEPSPSGLGLDRAGRLRRSGPGGPWLFRALSPPTFVMDILTPWETGSR
jgi:hypothetical protein